MLKTGCILILTGALALLTACAQAPAPARAPIATAATAAPTEAAVEEGPAINWDMPLPTGLIVTADQAQLVGKLPFTPIAPAFAEAPVRVIVSDPALEAEELRAAVFVYDFPPGQGIGEDGRVRVLEASTDAPETLFAEIVAGHVGLIDEALYDLVQVGGHDALLIHTDTIGRVRFVRDGVSFDVTGPALAPDTALALAEDLARTVDAG